MASPFNPYQAPAIEPLPAIGAGDFDIGQTVKDAFDRTKQYFGQTLVMLLVGGLLVLLAAVTVIGYFFAVPVFAWGLTKFFLNLQDQRQPQLNDLFAGFSNYWNVLGRALLLTVIYIGLTLVSESLVFVGQFLKSTPLIVVGYVIYIGFFCGVLTRLYFAFFFIVDRDLPAMAALSASWRATEGKALKLVGLALLSGLIAASGVLGLCVGALFTIPMSYAMYASAYRQVVGYGPPPAAGWGG
ncbi:MAG: hypothetical protein ABW061_14845 [Polyangiaceae bacterium]